MIVERGSVVAVEKEGVWVEAVQKSVCAGCKARQGCGQGLLSKYSKSQGYLWVLRPDPSIAVSEGDEIEFGLPDDVVMKSSLIIYLVPLVLLLVGVLIAHNTFPGDGPAILGALVGLVAGGFITKMHARWVKYDDRYQPQLLSVVGEVMAEIKPVLYGR